MTFIETWAHEIAFAAMAVIGAMFGWIWKINASNVRHGENLKNMDKKLDSFIVESRAAHKQQSDDIAVIRKEVHEFILAMYKEKNK